MRNGNGAKCANVIPNTATTSQQNQDMKDNKTTKIQCANIDEIDIFKYQKEGILKPRNINK